MTELLKRWADVEDKRASTTENSTAVWVWLANTWRPIDKDLQTAVQAAILLAAVIEAIEARGWRLTLVHNPWREERPKWGAWLSRYEEGDLALARRDHEADTPAEAVLSAYVAALEAEADQ